MVAVWAFGQATLKHDMTNTLSRSLTLALKAGIFALCCSVCIWWAYSMGAPGSFRTHHEAALLTIQMAMLTTCLTAVVWIASSYIHKRVTWLSLGIKTALETGSVLILYTAAVLAWRNNWTPEKGLSESAAFLPFVGHINAAFFSDFLWLEYLVAVVPLMSLLSGILTVATSKFDKRA